MEGDALDILGCFRCDWRNSFAIASGSSCACLGIPEKTRLSLMLPLRLKISFVFFSFESWVIPSVRDFTDTIKSWILCSESDKLLLA